MAVTRPSPAYAATAARRWPAGRRAGVVDVPDFPKPGVVFKDLMPLFADGAVFRRGDRRRSSTTTGRDSFDMVVGIEARGFVIAAGDRVRDRDGGGAGAQGRQAAPAARTRRRYDLEYGEATLEVHEDAFTAGHRVLVVDDVLATGGTAEATLDLVERAGGTVAGFTVLLELGFLRRAGAAGRRGRSMPC